MQPRLDWQPTAGDGFWTRETSASFKGFVLVAWMTPNGAGGHFLRELGDGPHRIDPQRSLTDAQIETEKLLARWLRTCADVLDPSQLIKENPNG